MPFLVVLLAIVPNQLNVIEDLFHSIVIPSFHFLLHSVKVHGISDDLGIVVKLEFFVV